MTNKRLIRMKRKISGRDSSGRVSVRHRGGANKRKLRVVDWKRDKYGIAAIVTSLEIDPNRSGQIAFLTYADGEKRYILAPQGLKIGDQVLSDTEAEVKIGNHLPLEKIPLGTPIHNLELVPGKGSQVVRSAGAVATLLAKEGDVATVRFPSGALRYFPLACWATIGQVSNLEHKNIVLGKAGRKRHLGIRPTVRGVAMNPRAHPHGGGEGRSGIGMPSPKSPWGKKTLGVKTRKKHKWSDKYRIKG